MYESSDLSDLDLSETQEKIENELLKTENEKRLQAILKSKNTVDRTLVKIIGLKQDKEQKLWSMIKSPKQQAVPES